MTGRARISLVAFLFAGACARPSSPVTAPEPANDSVSAAVPAAMEVLEKESKGAPPSVARPKPTPAPANPTPATPKPAPTPPPAPAPTPQRESGGSVEPTYEVLELPGPKRVPEASWDIEVKEYLSHDRVEFYVRRFTGSQRSTINSWMQRGLRYEPMIRKTFRQAGIPEDMYYLGLVESGFDQHAYSRAAAVGMWQFMTATARGVGLRVDWWVDERRDPVRSTRAAARFLSHLQEQFGSMYLAAAAYNGGPARVSRGLTRYANNVGDSEGDDQFFALAGTRALRSETSNYVPQLIAAAAIGKEPWKYGITLVPVIPYAYDSVLVPRRTAVAAVTLVTGAPLDSLKELNPHLIRGATPPDAETWVRVPIGSAPKSFASDFDALPDSVRTAWRVVKPKKSTTLTTMARAHGINATQLRWYNPKLKGTKIAAGASINVPTKLTVKGAFAVADPVGRAVWHSGERRAHRAER